MQRYKNIYIEESPKELVPAFHIQYNLEKRKQIEKKKIKYNMKISISKEKQYKININGVIKMANALSERKV